MSSNRYAVDQRAQLFGNRKGFARPGSPPPGQSRAEAAEKQSTREVLERQNDQHIDDLEARVSALKEITRGINKEVTDSTSFLETMGEGFDKAGTMLKSTINHLGVMMQTRKGGNVCYVAGFTVVMLFLMCSLRWFSSGPSGTVSKVVVAQNVTGGPASLSSSAMISTPNPSGR